MHGQQWKRWARALVLVVLGAMMLSPARAHADGPSEPPGEHERVVKIGPQAVVIVNEHGQSRMYDDPSQQVQGCKTNIGCMAKVLGIAVGALTVATYNNITTVDGSGGRTFEPVNFRE